MSAKLQKFMSELDSVKIMDREIRKLKPFVSMIQAHNLKEQAKRDTIGARILGTQEGRFEELNEFTRHLNSTANYIVRDATTGQIKGLGRDPDQIINTFKAQGQWPAPSGTPMREKAFKSTLNQMVGKKPVEKTFGSYKVEYNPGGLDAIHSGMVFDMINKDLNQNLGTFHKTLMDLHAHTHKGSPFGKMLGQQIKTHGVPIAKSPKKKI